MLKEISNGYNLLSFHGGSDLASEAYSNSDIEIFEQGTDEEGYTLYAVGINKSDLMCEHMRLCDVVEFFEEIGREYISYI